MPILCRVRFHDPIDIPPRTGLRALPIAGGWEKMPGWSIRVVGTRLEVTTEALEVEDSQFIPLEMKEELVANQPNEKSVRVVVSVPLANCDLHYIDVDPAEKGTLNRAPTPALLKFYEERKAKKREEAKAARPAAAPTSSYHGPPVTPARRLPPGAKSDPPPPPSEIVLPDEVEVDRE